ncbi:IS5 family transposase, partial [Streptomyces jumonjinensis]|uniref:IS5 family transposase n=2 Tax=Streptomyces jumonjinensis TaxID=1945 RepID=UPI0037A1A9B1
RRLFLIAHHDGLQPTQHEAVWSLPPQGDSEGPNLHLSHSTIPRSCPTTNSLSCSGHKTSKIHLAADRQCRPLAFVLTAGQAADSPQFIPVLKKVRVRLPVGRPRTRPGAVAADKAHSSRGNRAYLRRRRIKTVIPEKKDQAANRKKKGVMGGWPISHDAGLYKERNTVERLINKLKAWRGIATRYDKAPESYLAGLHLRAAMIWIDDLLKATE